MNIVIAGAGLVGSRAAHDLCFRGNEVTVVDLDDNALRQVRATSDLMTYAGDAAIPSVLAEAGVAKADLVLALTGNAEANLVICTIAKAMGVPKTVARLRTGKSFDPDLKLTPATFGVDDYIVPEEDCVAAIMDALRRPAVKECVPIGSRACEIVNFQVLPASPLDGVPLRRLADTGLLDRLRICAIRRHDRLHVPRGDTQIRAYDEAYVAGDRKDVDAFIEWATPEMEPIRRVLVTGANEIALMLAEAIEAAGMSLSVVVRTEDDAQRAIDRLGADTVVICGDYTDADTLQEAAADKANAVIAAGASSEENILTCILAHRLGALKVVSVFYNADYGQIIANLPLIDCGFNPLAVAVDGLLQRIGTTARQHVAGLNRLDAEVIDLVVMPKSRIAESCIADIAMPPDVLFVAILRNGVFVPPVGKERILPGDRVAVLVPKYSREEAERLFAARGIF